MCGFLLVNNEMVDFYVQNFYRTISDDGECYKSNDRIDVKNLSYISLCLYFTAASYFATSPPSTRHLTEKRFSFFVP